MAGAVKNGVGFDAQKQKWKAWLDDGSGEEMKLSGDFNTKEEAEVKYRSVFKSIHPGQDVPQVVPLVVLHPLKPSPPKAATDSATPSATSKHLTNGSSNQNATASAITAASTRSNGPTSSTNAESPRPVIALTATKPAVSTTSASQSSSSAPSVNLVQIKSASTKKAEQQQPVTGPTSATPSATQFKAPSSISATLPTSTGPSTSATNGSNQKPQQNRPAVVVSPAAASPSTSTTSSSKAIAQAAGVATSPAPAMVKMSSAASSFTSPLPVKASSSTMKPGAQSKSPAAPSIPGNGSNQPSSKPPAPAFPPPQATASAAARGSMSAPPSNSATNEFALKPAASVSPSPKQQQPQSSNSMTTAPTTTNASSNQKLTVPRPPSVPPPSSLPPPAKRPPGKELPTGTQHQQQQPSSAAFQPSSAASSNQKLTVPRPPSVPPPSSLPPPEKRPFGKQLPTGTQQQQQQPSSAAFQPSSAASSNQKLTVPRPPSVPPPSSLPPPEKRPFGKELGTGTQQQQQQPSSAAFQPSSAVTSAASEKEKSTATENPTEKSAATAATKKAAALSTSSSKQHNVQQQNAPSGSSSASTADKRCTCGNEVCSLPVTDRNEIWSHSRNCKRPRFCGVALCDRIQKCDTDDILEAFRKLERDVHPPAAVPRVRVTRPLMNFPEIDDDFKKSDDTFFGREYLHPLATVKMTGFYESEPVQSITGQWFVWPALAYIPGEPQSKKFYFAPETGAVEDADGTLACVVCHSTTGEEFLMCDLCDSAFHLSCSGLGKVPPLNEAFYCKQCKDVFAQVGLSDIPPSRKWTGNFEFYDAKKKIVRQITDEVDFVFDYSKAASQGGSTLASISGKGKNEFGPYEVKGVLKKQGNALLLQLCKVFLKAPDL